jgi:hypothetical protein
MALLVATAPTLVAATTFSADECAFRQLTYKYALRQQPARSPLLDVFDALELASCGVERPTPQKPTWPNFPTPKQNVWYVEPVNGTDAADGSLTKPFRSVHRALKESRAVGKAGTILLRSGIHHLNETIALDARDNGLTIQNYAGEEVWLSGGVPLDTSWSKWKPPLQSSACEAECVKEGHCCTGTTSSYNHPSCAMGCLMAAAGASTLAECEAGCQATDGKCESTFKDLALHTCGECPKGCDASDGAGECLEGCRLAFGVGGPNIWVTQVAAQSEGGPAEIESLLTIAPHARFTRARWPNPPSGTVEVRPAANVQPKRFLPPRKLPKARQVYVNATAQSNFTSSILEHYNACAPPAIQPVVWRRSSLLCCTTI